METSPTCKDAGREFALKFIKRLAPVDLLLLWAAMIRVQRLIIDPGHSDFVKIRPSLQHTDGYVESWGFRRLNEFTGVDEKMSRRKRWLAEEGA